MEHGARDGIRSAEAGPVGYSPEMSTLAEIGQAANLVTANESCVRRTAGRLHNEKLHEIRGRVCAFVSD